MINAQDDVSRRFDLVQPTGDTRDQHQTIQNATKQYVSSVLPLIGNDREQALFLTRLEEANYWAQSAVGRLQGQRTRTTIG